MTPLFQTTSSFFGDYYDGVSALRQRVGIRIDNGDYGHVLEMELPDGEHLVLWPVNRVRTLADQAADQALTCGLDTGAPERLVVRDPDAIRMMAEACPNLHKAVLPPPIWKRAVLVAGVGTALIAALIIVFLPGLASILAARISPEAEQALGATTFEQTRLAFASDFTPLPVCNDPAGMAAYRKLSDRVSQGVDLPYELKIAVFDDRRNPILNAFALPGGYITFLNSMLLAAETPEEIAAVFAHELGHVVHKDPTRGTLETASAKLIITLLTGDITSGGILGGLAGEFVTSSYSRGAETAADEFAHEQLERVGLPPSALGTMFQRLRDRYGDSEGLMAHLSSHPQLAARIEAAGADTGANFTSVLTPSEWRALRNICAAHLDEAETIGSDQLRRLEN